MRKNEVAALLTNFDEDFGTRLRAERTSRGLSQIELLNRLREDYGLDWAPSMMTKLEQGLRPARLSEALALAHALHTTVEELMYGSAYKKASKVLADNDIRREEMRYLMEYVGQRHRQIEKVDEAQSAIRDATETPAMSKED